MINITIDSNFDPSDLEKKIFEVAAADVKEKLIRAGITGLTISPKKDASGNMSLSLAGPADLLKKADEVLSKKD